MQHQYLNESNFGNIKGLIAKIILHYIRLWDYRTAHGVDQFIANSLFIARRIKKVYGRESTVIYPSVDISTFNLSDKKEDYYLTASRLVPYKKIDLVVEAFSTMPDKKLIVIGDGPDFHKIKKKATENIQLLGYQSSENLKRFMQTARAFVFAAEEDFGIIPVEAQACGTPVIAFGKGGVLETVRGESFDEPTGVFFERQTVESIVNAVHRFENNQSKILPANCRDNAMRFNHCRFRDEFSRHLESAWNSFRSEGIAHQHLRNS
jgi:glycosyltransferase involved in cell wall biosynthesis